MLSNRGFSRDVTAAMLEAKNNETAAMLEGKTNPVGVELFSYVKLSFVTEICMAAGHVSENGLYRTEVIDFVQNNK